MSPRPYVTSYTPPKDNTKQNSYLLPAGVAVLILLIAGGYLYRRRKLSNKPTNGCPRMEIGLLREVADEIT